MSLKFRMLAFLLGALCFFTALILDWQHFLVAPLNGSGAQEIVVVEAGDNLHTLTRKMVNRNVLKSQVYLLWYARLTGRGDNIHVGEYQLDKSLTADSLLKKLETGDVIQHAVTLVEGWTLKTALEQLATETKLKQQQGPLGLEQARTLFGESIESLEGLLFPDTYFYHAGMSVNDLVQGAVEKMHAILMPAWEARDKSLPVDNPYDALILASIVEKEGSAEEERPLIAGVMTKRLKIGMRLQVDASVIYGVGDAFDGDLTRKHLRTDQPYNTYTRAGLPPTPICLPSLAAIESVMHPKEAGYLYYVSRGDGTHVFSKTLAEHNRAVRKYQLNQGG